MQTWSEFSFVLKPSPLGGIGVFATHDIAAETRILQGGFNIRVRKIHEIPKALRIYCIYLNDEEVLAPERFDRMEIGWFINHSHEPNISNRLLTQNSSDIINIFKTQVTYTTRAIKSGEEILIDYNSLREPEHLKESYYASNKLF